MGDDTSQWLSAHVFYNGDQDRLMEATLWPLAKALKHSDAVTQFFFVRYWERGPHVRLRFKVPNSTEIPTIQQKIAAATRTHFLRWPSDGPLDAAAYDALQKEQHSLEYGTQRTSAPGVVIGSCVEYIPYRPELQRYGGAVGMAISEKQFDASSTASCEMLMQLTEQREQKTTAGLKMMLEAVVAFGMHEKEALSFFASYLHYWKRHVPGIWRENLQIFCQTYRTQRESINAFVTSLFRGDCPTPTPGWGTAMAQIFANICAQSDRISHGLAGSKQPRIDRLLLAAYLHMNNNRLGLLAWNEAYFAFLIVSSLMDCGFGTAEIPQ